MKEEKTGIAHRSGISGAVVLRIKGSQCVSASDLMPVLVGDVINYIYNDRVWYKNKKK